MPRVSSEAASATTWGSIDDLAAAVVGARRPVRDAALAGEGARGARSRRRRGRTRSWWISAAAVACWRRTSPATGTSGSTWSHRRWGTPPRTACVPVRADVARLPLADGCADVVSAGEILEHVTDLSTVVAEACRVLRPGGTLVLDTLADTALARFVAVTLAERVPGVPRGIHDPALFVNRRRLVGLCARHGVALRLRGIRPAALSLVRWLFRRRGEVPIVPSRSTAILFQGHGVKDR